MDDTEELNAKILKITMKIQAKYPELSKFLIEMTVTIPDKIHPSINPNNLNNYYNSLQDLLDKYIENQKLINL